MTFQKHFLLWIWLNEAGKLLSQENSVTLGLCRTCHHAPQNSPLQNEAKMIQVLSLLFIIFIDDGAAPPHQMRLACLMHVTVYGIGHRSDRHQRGPESVTSPAGTCRLTKKTQQSLNEFCHFHGRFPATMWITISDWMRTQWTWGKQAQSPLGGCASLSPWWNLACWHFPALPRASDFGFVKHPWQSWTYLQSSWRNGFEHTSL